MDSPLDCGVRLDDGTIKRIARENSRQGLMGRLALWVGALALVAAAWAIVTGRM